MVASLRASQATSAAPGAAQFSPGSSLSIIGPATLRYVATVKDGELHEVGERVVPGAEPQRVFEMRLKRVADTDWPAAGAVSPK